MKPPHEISRVRLHLLVHFPPPDAALGTYTVSVDEDGVSVNVPGANVERKRPSEGTGSRSGRGDHGDPATATLRDPQRPEALPARRAAATDSGETGSGESAWEQGDGMDQEVKSAKFCPSHKKFHTFV